MKKAKKLVPLLIVGLIFSFLIPNMPKAANNGPCQMRGYISDLFLEINTGVFEHLWRYENTKQAFAAYWSDGKGGTASYDETSNTLTITNLNITGIYALEMGDDFKINVIGNNKVTTLNIFSDSHAYYDTAISHSYGCSVSISGTGSINTTQVYFDSGRTKSTFNLFADVEINFTKEGTFPIILVRGTPEQDVTSVIKLDLTRDKYATTQSTAYVDDIYYDHACNEVQHTSKGVPAATPLPSPSASSSSAGSNDVSTAIVTLQTTSFTYNGFEKKPSGTVVCDGKVLNFGTDYLISYQNNTNAGNGIMIIIGIGNYTGTKTVTFTIKAATVSFKNTSKSFSAKSLQKKSVSFSVIKKSSGGKVSYSVTKGSKKFISVSKSGKVTVKKGAKKGSYSIKLTVAAKGNYKKTTKAISIRVK